MARIDAPGVQGTCKKYIQDFAKHGFKDLDEDAPYEAKVAEMTMIAAVSC